MENKQPINLFVLPNENKNNKYIELLLGSFNNTNVRVGKDCGNTLPSVFRYIFKNKLTKSKNIIHIQWPTVIYGSKYLFKSFTLLGFNSVLMLWLKLFTNTKVVWTMHNFFAHDYPHPYFDRLGSKVISILASKIVVQVKLSSIADKIHSTKLCFIPHGHYVGVYGQTVERNKNRPEILGFSDSDFVLLSLGVIAPYKKNEKLIEVVKKLSSTFPTLKLLIVGKGNEAYINTLKNLAGDDKAIEIRNKFVPDSEIPQYLSAADYSVFYYDDSEMTSGGIILSLSYDVPVITRDIPISDVINDDNGFVFHDDIELEDIISKVLKNNIKKEKVKESMASYDWQTIGKKYEDIYTSLWNI